MLRIYVDTANNKDVFDQEMFVAQSLGVEQGTLVIIDEDGTTETYQPGEWVQFSVNQEADIST